MPVSDDDVRVLAAYRWPGNVREMAAVMDRAVLIGQGRELNMSAALGQGTLTATASSARPVEGAPATVIEPLDVITRRHIEAALGRRTAASRGPHGAAAPAPHQPAHAARPHAKAEDRLARVPGAARERDVIRILDRLVTRGAAALTVTLVLVGAASAQTPAPAQPAPAPAPPPVVAGWNEGFFIQTPNGDNRLQIGVLLQVDGRFSLDDPLPITNTFAMRKVRPIFSGRVGKYIDFKMQPELAGSVVLLDGYFDIRFSPKLRLRTGKDKTPIGYELLIADASLIFPERSVVSLLVPNRDVGFQAQGDLAGGKLLYSAGIFNGNPPDGTSATTDVDTNNGKDLAGRIVVLPFQSTKTPAHRLSTFGFHLGGSTGEQTGALPSYRTSAGQTFFSFPATTTADGRRNRVTPAVFLYLKGFGGFAEYARTTQDIVTSGVPQTITNQAWGVTGSYVLTGEPTSERGVRPKAPFDPAAGAWGAVQVAARYAELTLDNDLFTSGIAAATASRKAQQLTLATNWFLNNYVKIYASYERFSFSGSRANENLILFRSQLAF